METLVLRHAKAAAARGVPEETDGRSRSSTAFIAGGGRGGDASCAVDSQLDK